MTSWKILILGDAGIYFNPLDALDIERCIIEMLRKSDSSLAILRKNAIERATKYTWINASEATLDFLSAISKLGKVII